MGSARTGGDDSNTSAPREKALSEAAECGRHADQTERRLNATMTATTAMPAFFRVRNRVRRLRSGRSNVTRPDFPGAEDTRVPWTQGPNHRKACGRRQRLAGP